MNLEVRWGGMERKVYLRRFEEHLSFVHGDFVGAGLWSAEEDDVLVREGLQRFRISPFVDGHILGAHTQPEVMWEASFFTLEGMNTKLNFIHIFAVLVILKPY